MHGTRYRKRTLIGAALTAIFLVTGCGGGPSSNEQAMSGGSAARDDSALQAADTDAAAGKAAAPAEGTRQQGTDVRAQAPDLRVDQRSIIYTGSITIRVDGNINQAAAKAAQLATGAGGFVSSDKRSTGGDASDATIELRIPADKFQSVVDQLPGVVGGKEEQRGINTEDVTEQTVDLDARITVQQARVDSGRRLLAQAKSLNDLVMLEREVATRESDLASLQGKKRRLADLTALSTISVLLLGKDAAVGPSDDTPGFLGGLASGWKALLASLSVLLTVLGALLPWLLVLGLPAWALFVAYRRYLRPRVRRPVPEPAPAIADGE
jgi:hypothetical protein